MGPDYIKTQENEISKFEVTKRNLKAIEDHFVKVKENLAKREASFKNRTHKLGGMLGGKSKDVEIPKLKLENPNAANNDKS